MILMVSLASLLGLLLLPFTRNAKLKSYYQYIYGFLIAMGASALFCDAVLHLIPEVGVMSVQRAVSLQGALLVQGVASVRGMCQFKGPCLFKGLFVKGVMLVKGAM